MSGRPKIVPIEELCNRWRDRALEAEARVRELERPAIEAKRGEIQQSYRELAAQAREDRDYEGAAQALHALEAREAQWAAEDAATPAAGPVPVKTAGDETGEGLATVRAERDEAITLAATQLPRVWRSAADMARELVRDGQSAEEIAKKLDRMAAVVERSTEGGAS